MSLSKPKILIVDDIAENLFALEKLLNKLDVEVIKASSGNEALALTLDHDFALILLDVQMPGMNGFEVGELLKFDEKTASIPIIFLTALDRDFDKEIKGYDSGAVDFLFKPLNEFILISKVKNFLELYKMRTNLEEVVAEKTWELSRAEAYLENIINSMPSILIVIDAAGKIAKMNHPAELFSGYFFKEVKGKLLQDIFPVFGDYIDSIKRVVQHKKKLVLNRLQKRISNNERYLNITVYSVQSDEMDGAVIIMDDVTEAVKIEQLMVQNEKILSLGGIAAGMAHEIKNPLAGIIQNIQIIKRRLQSKSDKNKEYADKYSISLDAMIKYAEARRIFTMIDLVLQSGETASRIITNMLNFSRKSDQKKVPASVTKIIDDTLELLLNDYRIKKSIESKSIRIVKDYSSEVTTVDCEYSKLQQVFLNILKNDIEAIADSDHPNDDPQIKVSVNEAEDYVHIIFADNGPGIPEDIKKRIFEPFFTTKKVGKGTGLGLSISYFIITEDHGGKMDVESEFGKGTKFKIQLPKKVIHTK